MVLKEIPTPAGCIVVLEREDRLPHIVKHYGDFSHDRDVLNVIDSLSFDKFLDIGAAFGYYSHYVNFQRPDVPVQAFEPEPFRFACLSTTTGNFTRDRRKVGRAETIYNSDGVGGMFTTNGQLEDKDSTGPLFHLKVPSTKLSTLLVTQVKPNLCVKVDVEGAERLIFEELLEHNTRRGGYAEHVTNSSSFIIEIHADKPDVDFESIAACLPNHKPALVYSGACGLIDTYLFMP